MEKEEYVECYIAFLDMLGFKNLISKSYCDEILRIYNRFYDNRPMVEAYLGDKNIINKDITDALKMKVMSDSICFYIDVNNPNALLCILMSCMAFQYKLYNSDIPIFLRGAIVRGNIYAKDDIIFGPGLTQAYLLEENNAKYPRIILTKETLQSMDQINENTIGYAPILKSIVSRDDDAFYVINCLKMLLEGDQKIYENVKNIIDKTLDTTEDISIRDKYLYLERKLQQIASLSGKGNVYPKY